MNLTFESTAILSNGVQIPRLGYGVRHTGEQTAELVRFALDAGYRHLDTAENYGTEKGIGDAIVSSGIPREELFLTSKIKNAEQLAHNQRDAFERTLEDLRTDYVDLFLIHWPMKGITRETWEIMEELYRAGRIRAIGVSNFKIPQLKELLSYASVKPVVNQFEFTLSYQNNELLDFCREQQIAFEAWGPLKQGADVNDDTAARIGKKYGKTAPQVILRWILQRDIIVFPKSSTPKRILENKDLFDFCLSEEDMAVLNARNTGLTDTVGQEGTDF